MIAKVKDILKLYEWDGGIRIRSKHMDSYNPTINIWESNYPHPILLFGNNGYDTPWITYNLCL